MKKHYHKPDWNPTSRAQGIAEALPFIALLAGLVAFIWLIIWLIENL